MRKFQFIQLYPINNSPAVINNRTAAVYSSIMAVAAAKVRSCVIAICILKVRSSQPSRLTDSADNVHTGFPMASGSNSISRNPTKVPIPQPSAFTTASLAANLPLIYSNARRGCNVAHARLSRSVNILPTNLSLPEPASTFSIRASSTTSRPIPTIMLSLKSRECAGACVACANNAFRGSRGL